ncbi:MAG: 2-oxo-tetronate isomerase [Pseudomonadota bacterium]
MPKFAANLSMMFNEHDFLDRFAAASKCGFRGVEFLFPYDFDASEIRAALDAHGLQQALFNAPPGDWQAGERGMSAIPGREQEFRDTFQQALEYAAIIEPGAIHVMAGNAAGKSAQATFVDNLTWAAEEAGDQLLVIEPINSRDMPSYFLSRSDQAMAIINTVGAPNLKLQFDLYHAQIMEGDLTRRMERLAPEIGHIQIAGVPERHEPDDGELNFTFLFEQMDALGYSGWVGCEYRPRGRTEDGLGWIQNMLQI